MARAVDPLPSDSESEGARASARKEKAPSNAMDVDEEAGGVEAGDDEEEYEIERIMDAKIGMFAKGRMGYLVKWKGYGDEHNSWVDEQDAGNAHDLIDEFWARNKKEKRAGRKSTGAPAGRPSTTKARKSSNARDESSEVEELRPKRRGRQSKAKREESDNEVEEVEEDARGKNGKKAVTKAAKNAPEEDSDGFQSMNQWMSSLTWEHIVGHIDTVERADDGKLMIYFTLKNGGRARQDSETCKEKMPRKLLDFYEDNLRWRVVPELD